MSSKPLNLPGKHLINASLLGANAATMAGFLSMGVGTPLVAASYLGASTLLSFIKGFTTTAAIGGADMRAYSLTSDRVDVLRPPLSGRYHGAQCLLVRQTVHVLYMKAYNIFLEASRWLLKVSKTNAIKDMMITMIISRLYA